MITCIIVDDEPLAIQIIEQHLCQINDLELIGTFQNPLEAFSFLQANSVDLVFLDIQMPLLTGIDLVKSLPNAPKVIFTTAHRNYAIESYELDVVDYLLKPVTFIRFFKAINKLRALQELPTSTMETSSSSSAISHDHIYVNANKKYIKVLFHEIHYVESLKDYIRIHTDDQPIITKDRISEFEKKLPDNFLRIHRSFIVNTSKISAFTSKDVEIDVQEIPIGESYKKEVLVFLKGE